MIPVYLGIGSNQGNPEEQLQIALKSLLEVPDSRLVATSSLYVSAPISPMKQADFLNAAVYMQTTLAPLSLLRHLQAVERAQGRQRSGPRWGPRPVDIDLLLYADQHIDLPELQVPHPEMSRRAFVLLPLQELNPALHIPGAGPVAALLPGVADQRISRLEPGG